MTVTARMTQSLVLMLALHASAHAGVLKDHPGHWLGDLKIPNGPTLKSGIEIYTRADGSDWASFSSPDQGGYDIPVIRIKEDGNTAELELPFGQMKLTWMGDYFKGEWTQGGATLPLDKLSKVDAFPKQSRPQSPVAPFPYREELLNIRSADGIVLGATLTVPTGQVKPNVVILVHGSGPQTRDEENAGHRTFAVLADYLARQGIAVLRYDKRGISRSTGDYLAHTQAQLIDDLSAVTEAVRTRHQFRRVGMIGHSEGPMLAAAVAAKHPQSVDFIVSLAGVGLPAKQLLEMQDQLLIQDRGASPAEQERLMRYITSFYGAIVEQGEPAARVAAVKALYEGLPPEDKELIKKYRLGNGTLSLTGAGQAALRVLLMVDPDRDWRAVKVPVLALNGSLDHQVPPASMTGIVSSLKAGGNRKVESMIFPSVNHMMQTARTGAETEYAAIDETMAPAVMEKVAAFVKRQR